MPKSRSALRQRRQPIALTDHFHCGVSYWPIGRSVIHGLGFAMGCGEGVTGALPTGYLRQVMLWAREAIILVVCASAGNRCSILQSASAMSSAVENWLMVEKNDSVTSPSR